MKNQYAKYKNSDGSIKHSANTVRSITSGLTGKFRFPFLSATSGSNMIKSSKIRKKSVAKQKSIRKMNRKG